jgi:hypothetical protein
MHTPHIADAVAMATAEALTRADLTRETTIEAIRRQVQRDVRRLFGPDGNLRPIHELSAEDASMIAGFETLIKNVAGGDGHQDTVIKVKLEPLHRYVEMAAKYHQLRTERLHVTDDADLIARLQAARKRRQDPPA